MHKDYDSSWIGVVIGDNSSNDDELSEFDDDSDVEITGDTLNRRIFVYIFHFWVYL